MARLNLVIADANEAYLDGLVDFLMGNYSQRFEISSFTKPEYLMKFLSERSRQVDILLISPELYSESISTLRIGVTVLLSPGRLINDNKGLDVVNKYQHGDKLASEITNIFAEKHKGEVLLTGGDKQTKVAAFYSPAGGAGKTSIAVNACMQCTQRGLSVFYLNLESAPSTPLFFDCGSQQNLSKIFYYLKEKNKNLTLKIEGVRCIDPGYGIHYFAPPDSALELEEMVPGELTDLIRSLKAMAQYDVIVIDMSSDLGDRNLAVLEESDEIFLVFAQDMASAFKAKALDSELEIILLRHKNWSFSDKATIVLNKCTNNSFFNEDGMNINGKTVSVRLPVVSELPYLNGLDALAGMDNEFTRGVARLLDRLCEIC